ncbi:MAG: polysaccharide deacetylase family protein [Clostridiales bacterium]|nr:polysaccharide deacetylase family protein [Clostridiales bacterium]
MKKLKGSVVSALIVIFVLGTGVGAVWLKHKIDDAKRETAASNNSSVLITTDLPRTTTDPTTPVSKEDLKAGWQERGNTRVFIDKDGKTVTDGIGEADGKQYLIKNKKAAEAGRVILDNNIYYVAEEGLITRVVYGDKPMVALTFDDGPSKYTEQILDVFNEYDQKATFFINGEDVPDHKNAIIRQHDEGFLTANHTQNHKTLTKLSKKDILEQISLTDDIVYELCGVRTKYLRPPGGAADEKVKSTVNMPLINWSVDTKDWSHDNADKTIREVKKSTNDGSIVLMHDRMKSTAEAVKTIVPELIGRGYQLVTIDEMALLRGGTKAGQVYYSFPPPRKDKD